MGRIRKKLLENKYMLVSLGLLIGSLTLLFLRYSVVLGRMWGALGNLWTSLVYYFKVVFLGDLPEASPSVAELPKVDLLGILGIDVAELQRKLAGFPDAFFVTENFQAYNFLVLDRLNRFARILSLLLPVVALLGYLLVSNLFSVNTNHGQKTKSLRLFLKLTTKPYRMIKAFLSGFFGYFRGSKISKVLFWLWLFNLNILTVGVEFLAFYFFFACTVSLTVLPVQLVKLLIDLLIMFSGLPWVIWAAIGFVIFDKIRRHIGLNKLRRNERRNRGALNEFPVCLYIVGRMGSKKTILMTDMILSMDAQFRDKSLEILCKLMKRYPNFPWLAFEKAMKEKMKEKTVTNLASTRAWVKECRTSYTTDPDPANIFFYNTVDHPVEYDDGLTVHSVWEDLSEYACAYFIFVIRGSYSMSNYSVRFDTQTEDNGNLPLYDHDFFGRFSFRAEDGSTYSRIIDFDLFRLGMSMIQDNDIRGSFEFGIYSISEAAKERLNQLGTAGMKRNAYEANQLNDLFNYSPKFGRHPATVDYYPFVRFFFDDQRADSLNADLRELCATVDIVGRSDLSLAMPGFVFEDMIHDAYMGFYDKFLPKLRNRRGDSTLTGFILGNIAGWISGYRERVYNTFGYYRLDLLVDEEDPYAWYLANKKILPNRYATDCFSAFFADRAKSVGKSLQDYPAYGSSRATLEELKMQNSYLIRDLTQIFEQEEENDDECTGFFV